MNVATLVILIASVSLVSGQTLPTGITVDTVPCYVAPTQVSNYFYRNKKLIGIIQPAACSYAVAETDTLPEKFTVEFYNSKKRDTFATRIESRVWLITAIENYYKPVSVSQWQKVSIVSPKIRLDYPVGWSHRLDTFDGIFRSRITNTNKITVFVTEALAHSEPLMIIRTPNTGGLTTEQLMSMNARMNPALDTAKNSVVDVVIDGRKFKSSQNIFMQLMEQHHFWYADVQEIIYLNYNLLEDERIRYPEVMKIIVQSIRW